MNSVNLVGNLTKDVEVRKTTTGKSVCSFTIAVNNGEKADYIPCEAWEKVADLMGQFLSKGSKVGIVGQVKTKQYEGKDGRTVYQTYVLANNVEFLSSRGEKEETKKVEENNFEVKVEQDALPFY